MAKKITFKGGPMATHILDAKHKKDGSVLLRIYPVMFSVAHRSLVQPSDNEMVNPVAKIEFESIQALDKFIRFLSGMRDNMIYRAGHADGELADKADMMNLFNQSQLAVEKAGELMTIMTHMGLGNNDEDDIRSEEEFMENLSERVATKLFDKQDIIRKKRREEQKRAGEEHKKNNKQAAESVSA